MQRTLVIRLRAATILELIVVITIIAVLAGLIYGFVASSIKSSRGTEDLSNMRQLYIGVTLYEQDYSDRSPEDLTFVLPYVKSKRVFESKIDPRPIDPKFKNFVAQPISFNRKKRSEYKISYPYLRTFFTSYGERSDKHDYAFQRADPVRGMIANPWVGTVTRFMGSIVEGQSEDSSHGPLMTGPVDRIRMDGSYYRLKKRYVTDSLGASIQDLFYFDETTHP